MSTLPYSVELKGDNQKIISYPITRSFESIFSIALFNSYFLDKSDLFYHFEFPENSESLFVINDHNLKFSPKEDALIEEVLSSINIIEKLLPFAARSILAKVETQKAAVEIFDQNKVNFIFFDENKVQSYKISKELITKLSQQSEILAQETPLVRFAVTADSLIFKEDTFVDAQIHPFLQINKDFVFDEISNFLILSEIDLKVDLGIDQHPIQWENHQIQNNQTNDNNNHINNNLRNEFCFTLFDTVKVSKELHEKEKEKEEVTPFSCEFLCEKMTESKYPLFIFRKDRSFISKGFCIECMKQKVEFGISPFFNRYSKSIDFLSFNEMPQPLILDKKMAQETLDNNEKWPQIPLGNIIWVINEEQATTKYIKLWIFGIVQFALRHSSKFVINAANPKIVLIK
ncbi:hypothetical protein TRFO_36135 [Tritrichomonas foetus]|uniref:Uncharacterized protein n=1 Tax=Tritrichomonas foetus TaxID=1144522 RepID=A0A1J4JJ69_9EUKA|nr:hypothetical protein TRFO_36135 [Tritrichomonas foetus]|eukprot:OHS97597.1 hypothetical protein TRFO_36135 [Tritrichomonas foetus]